MGLSHGKYGKDIHNYMHISNIASGLKPIPKILGLSYVAFFATDVEGLDIGPPPIQINFFFF